MTIAQHSAFDIDAPAPPIDPASIFDLGPQHVVDETDNSTDLHNTFAQMMTDPTITATRQKAEEKRLQIRDQRLRQCGTRCKRRFGPEDGELKSVIYFCDCWRNQLCTSCFDSRKDYLLGRAHSAVMEARKDNKRLIRKMEVSKKDGNKLARKLSKDEYVRLPLEDDLDLFLIDSDDFDGGEEITYDEVTKLDWDKLTDTTKGRNVSGHLGKPKDTDDDDDVELISVESVVLHSDTTREQEQIALEAVAEKTGDLDPKTAKEVEKAIFKRTKVYVAALRKAGGKILGMRTITIKCRTSCIDWKRYTEKTAMQQARGGNGVPF